MLCKRCRKLFKKQLTFAHPFEWRPKPWQLVKAIYNGPFGGSVRSSCHICNVLSSFLAPKSRNVSNSRQGFASVFMTIAHSFVMRTRVGFWFPSLDPSKTSECYEVKIIWSDVPVPYQFLVDKIYLLVIKPGGRSKTGSPGRTTDHFHIDFRYPMPLLAAPPVNNTCSQPSFDTAFCWLQKCKQSHQRCQIVAQRPYGYEIWNPTRLLYLVPSGSKAKPRMFLQDSSAETAQLHYAALSYCWGPEPRFLTTQGNIEKLKSGIPFKALPKTFRDAVVATIRLGPDIFG